MGATSSVSLPTHEELLTPEESKKTKEGKPVPQREVHTYSVAKQKEDVVPIAANSLEDFELEEEGPPAPWCDAKRYVSYLMEDPSWSVYCVDIPRRRVIYCFTGDVPIYDAPFLYTAQFENATKLASVPLEFIEELLADERESTGLDPRDKVSFLFSTGRCGSTLLGKLMCSIPKIAVLQEPDPLFQCCYLVDTPELHIISFLRLIVRLHMKPRALPGKSEPSAHWVFKFRSQSTMMMDIFFRAFPNSRALFMYRHGEAVTKSITRIAAGNLGKLYIDKTVLKMSYGPVGHLVKEDKDLLGLFWLCTMETVQGFFDTLPEDFKSNWIRCVRYEDITAHAPLILYKLVKHIQADALLPPAPSDSVSTASVEQKRLLEERCKAVLSVNSQKGSIMESNKAKQRDHSLVDEMVDLANRYLKEVGDRITGMDDILPNTIAT